MIPVPLIGLATRFQLTRRVSIESRGDDAWCIFEAGLVLDGHGNWIYEPQPSSRDDDFIKATRFTLSEAYRIAHEAGLVRPSETSPALFPGVTSFAFGAPAGMSVEVRRRDDGKWAVSRGMADYNRDGEWETSPWPGDTEFLDRTGHTWVEAMSIAAGQVPPHE